MCTDNLLQHFIDVQFFQMYRCIVLVVSKHLLEIVLMKPLLRQRISPSMNSRLLHVLSGKQKKMLLILQSCICLKLLHNVLRNYSHLCNEYQSTTQLLRQDLIATLQVNRVFSSSEQPSTNHSMKHAQIQQMHTAKRQSYTTRKLNNQIASHKRAKIQFLNVTSRDSLW